MRRESATFFEDVLPFFDASCSVAFSADEVREDSDNNSVDEEDHSSSHTASYYNYQLRARACHP
jgi:hypothetical protein